MTVRCPEALVQSLDRLVLREGIFVTPDAGQTSSATWAMRLMHSALLARVYEDLWRPTTVRSVSTLTYASEDAIVNRYLQDRIDLKILDLCCGTARVSRRLVDRGATVLGMDTSWVMLREARRRCQNTRLVLVQRDARNPLARPGKFDAAFCFAALHLLDEPERVISTAAAALHISGLFFAWVVTAQQVLRARFVQSALRTLGIRLWEHGSLASRMHAHRFEILETCTFGAIELVVGRRRGEPS